VNEHTSQLVRERFDLVEPSAPQAAALFYAHPFATDPSVRPLFRGDMIQQGEQLMKMIALVVARLDEPDVLRPAPRPLPCATATTTASALRG
jgi:hemoglobin-like flavoprotein